ncbi:MAG: hypothetical protein NT062_36825 [Proteobacteria bacterium]|nr:hypothetical protein [Pseudomonadota bacterium]
MTFPEGDEPLEDWNVLIVTGEEAEVQSLEVFGEENPGDDVATKVAALPHAQTGSGSAVGANGGYEAYAVRDPQSGVGWVACWQENGEEPGVSRTFSGKSLKIAIRDALREMDEEGAGHLGERPAPYSSYSYSISRPSRPPKSSPPSKVVDEAAATEKAIQIPDGKALRCKACRRPVFHYGPIDWKGEILCEEGPVAPCDHVKFYLTGNSDFPVYCAPDLLARAIKELSTEDDDDEVDPDEALEPGGWLYTHRDPFMARVSTWLSTPTTIYVIEAMDPEWLGVAGSTVETCKVTAA